MNFRDFKAKYAEGRAAATRGRRWSQAMVSAFTGATSIYTSHATPVSPPSPWLWWIGVAFIVWAAYEVRQAIREREGVAEVKWWVLGIGVVTFFHVTDALFGLFFEWQMGINLDEFYHPHYDDFVKNQTIFGLGMILLGVAMFAFEAKRRAAPRPSTGA